MKQLPDKYYSNLTSRQRFVATWEAIGRGDDAEAKRLRDTAPNFKYSSADHVIRRSWDAVITISLGVEADIRGYALTAQVAHQAGLTEVAVESLKKMKKLDAAWKDLLKEIGLSEAAIREARPEPHALVEHLLKIVENCEPEPDETLDDYFTKIRQMLPIL